MDVLHGDLEAVEASSLRDLHLRAELLGKVLQNNPVGCREKGKHVFDEMLLFFVEALPVLEVLIEIDLISSPERSKMFLVHLVDGVVLNGEEHEALRVLGEQRLFLSGTGEGRVANHDLNYEEVNLNGLRTEITAFSIIQFASSIIPDYFVIEVCRERESR